MSYDNRELVEYFLSYKLAQRNYPPSLLRPEEPGGCTEGNQKSPAAVNGLALRSRSWSRSGASPSTGAGIKAVHAALRDSAEEFEKLFAQAFSDLSSQLVITPDTAYQSFKNVMDEVFKDEVNWGRIVGLFAFGGALSVESAEKGASELVCRIADWMTIYLDEHINPWIQNQGGWVSGQRSLWITPCLRYSVIRHPDYTMCSFFFFFRRMNKNQELISSFSFICP